VTTEAQPVIEAVLSDLGVDKNKVLFLEDSIPTETPDRYASIVIDHDVIGNHPVDTSRISAIKELCGPGLIDGGCLIIFRRGHPSDKALAAFRNQLWPHFHTPAFYILNNGKHILRRDLAGVTKLSHPTPAGLNGYVAVAVGRDQVFSPGAVTKKFDENAAGWNGIPGSPSYGHFRWMRRIMAEVAKPEPGVKLLDAGCGAGWVGLEAASMGAEVSAFDPSPEMIKIVASNAKELGVEVELDVGFAENSPFNGPFETVISSGVISFSSDHDAFFDGVDSVLEKNGLLVLGDLNYRSRGMTHRRLNNPVIPLREMNALTRDDVVEKLKRRGYKIEKVWFYQLTRPIPQLMHISETRMGGLGAFSLLMLNKAAFLIDSFCGSFASGLFDSYIVKARKHGPPMQLID